MKKKTPEQELKELCKDILKEIQRIVITDAERDRNADWKDLHTHPHSRPFRQADYRLPEGEAAGGGRKGTGRQWRRDAERDECGGVPGDGEGG